MSQQINLFNPIYLKQKKYFSAVAMAQALGLILMGVLVMTLYANYRISSLKRQAFSTSHQLTAAQTQLAQSNAQFAQRQNSKSIENEIVATELEIQSLQQVFDILKKGDFGNTKGYSEYLKAFARQSLGGLWLTGFSIVGAGNEIGLQGRALQPELVPAYINRLKQEQALRGKSFSSLEMLLPQMDLPNKDPAAPKLMGPAPYIDFSLQSTAGQGADVSAITASAPASAAVPAAPPPAPILAVPHPPALEAIGLGPKVLETAAAQSGVLSGANGK